MSSRRPQRWVRGAARLLLVGVLLASAIAKFIWLADAHEHIARGAWTTYGVAAVFEAGVALWLTAGRRTVLPAALCGAGFLGASVSTLAHLRGSAAPQACHCLGALQVPIVLSLLGQSVVIGLCGVLLVMSQDLESAEFATLAPP